MGKNEAIFSGPFLLCKLGKADLKEELAKVLVDWGWSGTVDQLVEYWFSIGNITNTDVLTIARDLRSQGVKCFLATNQEKYRADFLRNGIGLKDVFDGMLVSAEIGHTKKEGAFFEEAYKRINANEEKEIQKNEILFVDHEEETIAAANAFGLETYMYQGPGLFREVVFAA